MTRREFGHRASARRPMEVSNVRPRGLTTRWRVALGTAAVVLLVQPASAFYWYGWPGSGVTDPPALVTRPPTVMIVTEETPPAINPDFPDDVPSGPQEVPEPATLLAAAVGLATVALARRRKAKADAQRRSP